MNVERDSLDERAGRSTAGVLGKVAPALGVVLFGAALWVLHRALAQYHYHDVVPEVLATPPVRLGLAVTLTALSYLTLTGYDVLALRYIGRPLGYAKIALASFIGYAFSNNIGHSLITGGSVRFRLYSAWGLSAVEIAKVVGFCVVTFWVGFLAVGGVVLLVEPLGMPGAMELPIGAIHPLGALGLALSVAYVAGTAVIRRPIKFREWEFGLPPPRLAGLQVGLASLDWVVTAGAFAALVPDSPGVSVPLLIGVFLVAQIAGLASQIPGGLGVFESVVVALLAPAVPASSLVGALVTFRIVYYLAPLALAAVLLGIHEGFERRDGVQRVARVFGLWVSPLVPHVLAFGAFVGGAVLLLSGATPAVGSRMAWLKDLVPLPVLELSHFLASVTGIALLLLARSLQQRVDASYFMAAGLLSAGIVASLLKGFDYEEAIVLGVMLAALLPCRRHFYRHASLIGERFTPGWIAAISLVLLGSIWLGIFSYKHVEYSNELWWRFSLTGDAPRYLRATVGAVGAALVFALAHLLRPAPTDPGRPDAKDVARALPVIAASRDTTASLALLGDKSFLFTRDGTGLIMYGVSGRSWVALGDPLGPAPAQRDLVWSFRELSDRHGGWTVFYQVRRDHLHLYLDVGLSLMKLGEEGRVPLERFTLEGGGRKGLRYLHRRVEKEGVRFDVIPVDSVPGVLDELAAISHAWLADKRTREKGFSLGAFTREYVMRFPIAAARRDGRIVAFANVWQGAEREELSVDLMRHLPDAPHGVMDFLFIELMQWGRREGYQWFSLGMAPLSGLESRALAPLWTRLGAFVFRHGEHFYNFQGLREYKEKFDPVWEPKYLASPGGFALPRILADVASLIAGGLKGVVGK